MTSGRHRVPTVTKSRGDIQGLRALAVLLVVFGHAGLFGLSGGYVGVDVFFVISGFLITSLLLREATGTGTLSLVGFYARRAKRILPAATATLVATSIVATVVLPYIRAQAALQDVAWATVFAVNIHFGQARTDYFATNLPPSPIQHFWSLSVEEQFYLVWPTLMIVVLILGARRSSVQVERRLPRLALLVAVLCALSLAWSVYATRTEPNAAYFSTFTRAWELGAGALLAFAGASLARLTRRARAILAVVGLALVLLAGFLFSDTTPVPGYHMLVPVLGTIMLIAAGTGAHESGESLVSRLLGKQPLRWIGDVSYGFYLWHWPLLILGRAYFGRHLGVPALLGLIGFALVLAWLSYVLLENPIRRSRGLSRRPRLALLLWPAAVGCLVAAIVGSNLYIDHQRTVLATAASQVDVSKVPPAKRAPRDGNRVHDALADALDRATLGAPLTLPSNMTATIGPWLSDPSCGAQNDQSESRICAMGDVESTRQMVILGDSHILMWLPALQIIAQQHGYKLIPITKLGCTPYDVVAWKFDTHGPYTSCNQWRAWALQQIKAIQPDVVVVGSASAIGSADPATGKLMHGPRARRTWRAGAESLANQLTAIAPHVDFLQDVNRLPFKPSVCLSNLNHTAADCTFKESAWVTRSNRLVRAGISGTGARYVHVRDLFCEQQRCPTVVHDLDVYGDGNHITPAYAKFLAGDLGQRLKLPS